MPLQAGGAAGVAATGVPLLDTLVGLGSGTGISTGSLLLYASAATGAYALWEQLRFRMARCGAGMRVPGRQLVQACGGKCVVPLGRRNTCCWLPCVISFYSRLPACQSASRCSSKPARYADLQSLCQLTSGHTEVATPCALSAWQRQATFLAAKPRGSASTGVPARYRIRA